MPDHVARHFFVLSSYEESTERNYDSSPMRGANRVNENIIISNIDSSPHARGQFFTVKFTFSLLRFIPPCEGPTAKPRIYWQKRTFWNRPLTWGGMNRKYRKAPISMSHRPLTWGDESQKIEKRRSFGLLAPRMGGVMNQAVELNSKKLVCWPLA